ncbi:helix-turn-helix transcriptional regulator [Desulfatitalea tepidiphila]|uniref:helix-turn-helix transcriptional regulator n=1 Tax=Desulfatitalea tepidiphila TaxID=1185843 RepID=UPI00097713D0
MGRKKSLNRDTIRYDVKEFRLKKGWSQEELAESLGIRRQAIYDIESGRNLPNTAIVLQLAGCSAAGWTICLSRPRRPNTRRFRWSATPSNHPPV